MPGIEGKEPSLKDVLNESHSCCSRIEEMLRAIGAGPPVDLAEGTGNAPAPAVDTLADQLAVNLRSALSLADRLRYIEGHIEGIQRGLTATL